MSLLYSFSFGSLVVNDAAPTKPASAASNRIIFKIPNDVVANQATINYRARRIGADAGLRGIKRAYRHAGKFESRHREYGLHLWYYGTLVNSTDRRGALIRIQSMSPVAVAALEPTTAVLDFAPNDPLYPDYQAQYLNSINMEGGWSMQQKSTRVIQIVDSGIHISSDDLAANIWRNLGEICGNGIDDDNNGFVDDCNGYNFFEVRDSLILCVVGARCELYLSFTLRSRGRTMPMSWARPINLEFHMDTTLLLLQRQA